MKEYLFAFIFLLLFVIGINEAVSRLFPNVFNFPDDYLLSIISSIILSIVYMITLEEKIEKFFKKGWY